MSIGHSSSAYSLRLREAERQRDRGGDDDRLPAPEVDLATARRDAHPRLEQALRRVVDAGEDRVAGEREDHRVRVQRAQPAEGEPWRDVSAGTASCSATSSPTSMPTMPQTKVARGTSGRWHRRSGTSRAERSASLRSPAAAQAARSGRARGLWSSVWGPRHSGSTARGRLF